MVAPTAPLPGLNPVIVGAGKTVKFVALVIVTPLVVIEIGPEVAPTGTVVVMLVDVEALTVALMPPKATTGEALKSVPVMMTVAPTAPLVGLNSVMIGVGKTVKLVGLETVTPFKVTVTGPVVAPAGTTTVNLLAFGLEAVTIASTPLKRTTFCAAVVLKLSPLIVTIDPTAPLVGVMLVITGEGSTVKLLTLVAF